MVFAETYNIKKGVIPLFISVLKTLNAGMKPRYKSFFMFIKSAQDFKHKDWAYRYIKFFYNILNLITSQSKA